MLSTLLLSSLLTVGSHPTAAGARAAAPLVAALHRSDSLGLDKIDPALHSLYLDARPHSHRGGHDGTAEALAHVLVETTAAEALAADYPDAHPAVLGDRLVALSADAAQLRRLGADPRVESITPRRTFAPLLDKARRAADVDRVQSGKLLDTPFDGRGVISRGHRPQF